MKKYLLIAFLTLGMFGITASIGQDGPKEIKKERKSLNKEQKMEKKEYKGKEHQETRKRAKAHKKTYRSEVKDAKRK